MTPARVASIPGIVAIAVVTAACGLLPATPSPLPSATATPSPSAVPSGVPQSATPVPTATPAPAFTVALPDTSDPRAITVTVEHDAGEDEGELLVTVVNTTDQRVDELVLRWATELNDALFLAPFVPSEERIREGGPPLVQEWTKWVIGPGERGEPAGTISLGYGPLMPGATLAMPIHAERRAAGPIAFDLQVLAGNDILTLAEGGPAALRVEVP